MNVTILPSDPMYQMFKIWRTQEVAAAAIAARYPLAPATLGEAYQHEDTAYIESAGLFERWAYAPDASVWYCASCGSLVGERKDDGCSICGYGEPDDDHPD